MQKSVLIFCLYCQWVISFLIFVLVFHTNLFFSNVLIWQILFLRNFKLFYKKKTNCHKLVFSKNFSLKLKKICFYILMFQAVQCFSIFCAFSPIILEYYCFYVLYYLLYFTWNNFLKKTHVQFFCCLCYLLFIQLKCCILSTFSHINLSHFLTLYTLYDP